MSEYFLRVMHTLIDLYEQDTNVTKTHGRIERSRTTLFSVTVILEYYNCLLCLQLSNIMEELCYLRNPLFLARLVIKLYVQWI